MEMSDQGAVAAVRAGDRDAFRVLVEKHSRNIFRLGYRMTGNEQDAEPGADGAERGAEAQAGGRDG